MSKTGIGKNHGDFFQSEKIITEVSIHPRGNRVLMPIIFTTQNEQLGDARTTITIHTLELRDDKQFYFTGIFLRGRNAIWDVYGIYNPDTDKGRIWGIPQNAREAFGLDVTKVPSRTKKKRRRCGEKNWRLNYFIEKCIRKHNWYPLLDR